jgi:hypothetical protein
VRKQSERDAASIKVRRAANEAAKVTGKEPSNNGFEDFGL